MRVPAAIFLLLLSACSSGPWDAFVYDDAENLDQSETLVGFGSFEECQQAAIDRLREKQAADVGTYECGKDCRWDPVLKVNVCKETRD